MFLGKPLCAYLFFISKFSTNLSTTLVSSSPQNLHIHPESPNDSDLFYPSPYHFLQTQEHHLINTTILRPSSPQKLTFLVYIFFISLLLLKGKISAAVLQPPSTFSTSITCSFLDTRVGTVFDLFFYVFWHVSYV